VASGCQDGRNGEEHTAEASTPSVEPRGVPSISPSEPPSGAASRASERVVRAPERREGSSVGGVDGYGTGIGFGHLSGEDGFFAWLGSSLVSLGLLCGWGFAVATTERVMGRANSWWIVSQEIDILWGPTYD